MELHLSENAIQVLDARYLRRNRSGELVETPEGLFSRVASAVSEPELLYGSAADGRRRREEFLQMMTGLEFLPNSPTLMNAGSPMNQLSACFVLPVSDTIEDIFDAVKQMAMVQRSGGGTGFSFSKLRPSGDFISSTGGKASGPVSFMDIFNCATANIKQGGKRRGANMGVLQVDHPDILEFIRAKSRDGAFENFNLSVLVDDGFMEASRQGAYYDLRHPRDGRPSGRLNAGEVFKAIYETAWETGDPGLIFADKINADNPTPHLDRIVATNPCGEIPLLDYESCNLGSINLVRMLDSSGRRIDWNKLRNTAAKGVRFLDNVIDVSQYPIRAIEKMTLGNRKIGLGVMGFADMLIRMEVAYDSDKAVDLAREVMKAVSEEAFRASRRLAEERGVYPHWRGSVHQKNGQVLRNATQTAVAPTGSISIIAGTTPSIEPLFALAYRRTNVLGGRTLHEVNPLFKQAVRQSGLDPEQIGKRIRKTESLADIDEVPDHLKEVFKTALQIPVMRHLKIQQAFQQHVDNSVSKTINLPEDAKPKDVADAYRRAWEMGLKGITIYRYGSKSSQVLQVEEEGGRESTPASCEKCAI
ncbi:MAG: adenosylcobalamin-dependent ribonucleoside-diphosphate reductase [Desulfobacterales bacterium]|nr:adenosylcobalamin-dependent ribonucleoside-diphosphate reductase [Desulfobacterales bacterium]